LKRLRHSSKSDEIEVAISVDHALAMLGKRAGSRAILVPVKTIDR
jgi:hypothetical protein